VNLIVHEAKHSATKDAQLHHLGQFSKF